MEFQPYTTIPSHTVTAAPVRQSVVEGVPVIRVTKEAPSNERKCTDVKALCVFIIFLVLAVYIGFIAVFYGGTSPLTHGINYNGRVCGSGLGLLNHPYLFFPLDPTANSPKILPSARKCLRVCPTIADVKAGKVIPISKTQIDRSPRGTSSTLVEYSVNTPVYASIPVAGRFCFPVDPPLGYQLSQQVFNQPLTTFRRTIGSVATGAPVVFVSVVITFLLCLLHGWMFKTCPKIVLLLSSAAAVVASFTLGILLLLAATSSSRGGDQLWMNRLPVEISLWLLGGVGLIIASIGFAVLLFLSRHLLVLVGRVTDATADVLWARGGILGSPILLSILNFVLGWGWLLVFLLLCGSSSGVSNATPLSPERNGGVLVISAEKRDYFPMWAYFSLIIWGIAGFWVLEFIGCLLKFSICYTGTMWYFTGSENMCDDDEAFRAPETRLTPSLVSLSIGLLNHAGSFAAAALGFGCTRIFRTVTAWAAPRYFSNWNDDSDYECSGKKIFQILTSNGFVEMSVASTSLATSMKIAAKRGRQPTSIASRFLGAATLGISITATAIILTSGIITFSVLSTNLDYSLPTSPHYVPSPLFVTFVSMLFSAAVASPQLSCWAVFSDALLYCYLLEGSDANFGENDPSCKTHAPISLKTLILDELEDEDE